MKSFLLLFSFLLSLTVVNAQDTVFKQKFIKKEQEIDIKINSLLKSNDVKGLSIALIDSSGTIWSKGYGYSNYSTKALVDQKTIFCFGSISKIFTAIAIMQLHEQGKIDINKSVQQYLPEFNPLGAQDFIQEITIKSILSHHSGLPCDNLAMFYTNKPYSAQNIINYLNNQYVCTKPYTISSYSNISFSLLGAIVERVSGQSFAEYVKTNICVPLGMKNSSFNLEDHMKPLLTKQYFKGNGEYVEPHVGELLPAGGFYSNIEDMSLFVQMLLNKGKLRSTTIISEDTFRAMTSIQNSSVHKDYDMAIGFPFFITMDGTWFKAGGSFSHGGNTLVFHSGLTVLPYQNKAIILSSNSKNGIRIVPQIERFVLEKALEVTGIDSLFPKQTISKKQKKEYIKPENFSKFEGLYSFMYKPMQLKAKKNSIVLKAFPLGFVLKPASDSSFNVKIRILGISFKNKNISKMWFDFDGNDTIIVATSWDRNFYFSNKIHTQTKGMSDGWKDVAGEYVRADSSELFKTTNIKIEHDYIYITSSEFAGNKLLISALPLNNTQLKVCGLGRNTGDIISFDKQNNSISFNFAGIVFKKK